ncbi:MAG: sulfite exporter TauE/SafE family protein [Bacteroidia bacterium]
MFLAAAFIAGFLGSFHCVGMCGPIALSLPVNHFAPFKRNLGILLYNSGRIFTYTLLGILFGLLGRSFSIIGLQRWVSVSVGIILLLSLFVTKLSFTIPALSTGVNKLKTALSGLFSKRGLRFLFGIGLLNGLLPCGLVYLGIAGAVASQGISEGALFMFAFGVGTLPVMYSVALAGRFVTVKFRNAIRKTVPYVVCAMALLLILRGLNLGIPYLSPSFDAKTKTMSCCEVKKHKK